MPIHSTHSSSVKTLSDGKCTKEDNIDSLISARPNMLVVDSIATCPFTSLPSNNIVNDVIPIVPTSKPTPSITIADDNTANIATKAAANKPSAGEKLKNIIEDSKSQSFSAEDYLRLAEEAERWIAMQ